MSQNKMVNDRLFNCVRKYAMIRKAGEIGQKMMEAEQKMMEAKGYITDRVNTLEPKQLAVLVEMEEIVEFLKNRHQSQLKGDGASSEEEFLSKCNLMEETVREALKLEWEKIKKEGS